MTVRELFLYRLNIKCAEHSKVRLYLHTAHVYIAVYNDKNSVLKFDQVLKNLPMKYNRNYSMSVKFE